MKLPITCMQCFTEQGKPSEEIVLVEFRDDGRYEFTCKKGHLTITFLQQQKFEILFEIGAYAIRDGYYREAVSSFTSSLERFYEFYIKVIAIEKEISQKEFDLSWKKVSKQSERQLGAFVFVYTIENGTSPPLPRENQEIKFRNDVIHKGKIPTRQEALGYGNKVLELIRPVLKDLKEKYGRSVGKAITNHLPSIGEEGEPPYAMLCIRTILSLSQATPGYDERTLEEAILGLRKFKS